MGDNVKDGGQNEEEIEDARPRVLWCRSYHDGIKSRWMMACTAPKGKCDADEPEWRQPDENNVTGTGVRRTLTLQTTSGNLKKF